MHNSSSESLSFPQAIAATQALMEQINSSQLSEIEIKQHVKSILSSKNGGRGFFVAYLTSDMPLVDQPPPGVLNGLKSAPEIASELLVKNLAMSSAMIIAHHHNDDSENLAGSQRVYRRTYNLIQQLNCQLIKEKLQELHNTINHNSGKYQEFLEHWNYSSEQKKAIQEATSTLILEL